MEIIEVVGGVKPAEILKLLGRKPLVDESVLPVVREIVEAVRTRGDEAVAEYTEKFDGVKIAPDEFEVTREELDEARSRADMSFMDAVRESAGNIRRFCEASKAGEVRLEDENILVEEWVTPLNSAGLYIPGGRFPYPSTVLMNAVPAKTAGVPEVIMCTPPDEDGEVDSNILAVAAVTAVDRVFRIGGAQAIAAMAYGTATVPKVDKIAGPGNVYVMMAKREVFGEAGIDMLAGPSEVLIIADASADADFVAQDMKAQAEHDPRALSILVTNAQYLAESVRAKVGDGNFKILLVESIDDAVTISDIIAPEHLEILTENADAVARMISNAGAIFIGPWTPAVVGDYIAGPNHTLPTNGTARFASPLSVNDFVKRTSVIRYSKDALKAAAKDVKKLAETEGLKEHAKAIDVRIKKW
ncbi:MAG: histidinol dehydrogenase [Actinomycetota bacterium]